MHVLGHRGASRAAPENSPAAFGLADRMGADGVELDVRLAADGRLLVHHDPLPTDPVALAALPGLAEVLDACGDRMLVNVEIKHTDSDAEPGTAGAVADATLAELAARGAEHARRWLVSSFSWEVIEHCRRRMPAVPTAWLVVEAGPADIECTARAGHLAIHPHVGTLDADVVARCHEVGLAVHGWTCNDPDRLVELAAAGVDGVCTDVPDVALESLGRGADPPVTPRWGRPA